MAYQAIGKIAMTPKGNWTDTEPYQQLDIVTYEGNIYIASKDIAKNISPKSASSDWQLLLTTEQVQGDLNNQINQLQNIIDTIDSNQQTLDKTINIIKNIYGAPAKASSVNEMTDTNRVYVYTGETSDNFKYGFWYYYNGSTWDEGGQYNSIAVETDSTLTLEGVPADAKATGELKTAIETFYPHASGAGTLVTVAGTVDAPLVELTIYGRSVQNGTPAPDAPVDIVTAGSGGTLVMVSAGKNLLKYVAALSDVGDSMTSLGLTVKHLADGGLSIVGTTSNSGNIIISGLNNSSPLQIPDGRYTLTQVSSGLPSSSNVYMWLKSGQTKFAPSSFDFVRNEVDASANIGITFSAGVEVNCTVYPMLRLAEIADATFDPYNGVSAAIDTTPNGLPGVPVTSGGNYTDTNGQQWICDTIDLEAGVWTKRCGVVTLDGSVPSDWRKDSTTSGNYRFAYPKLVDVIQRTNNDSYAPLLCSHYPVVSANGTWSMGNRNGIAVADNGGIYVTDAGLNTSGSTVADLMAKFSAHPMTIVYALAAPVVTQLTNTQLTALNSIRSRKEQTNLYSIDPSAPEIDAKMYINFQNYIQPLINKQHKFRVCSWNIGNFAYGDLSGGTSENSNRKSNTSNRRGPIGNDIMYDQMIDAFNESHADIYLFCEWNRYWNKNWTTIDTTQDIEAMNVLEKLKPYWTSHNPSARTDKYAGHKIASNWPIIYEYAVAYGNDEDRYFVGAVCSIAGREVHFVSIHLNPNISGSAENIDEGGTSTAKTRRREFKILQDYLTSIRAKYVVLGGDFNIGGPNATAQTTSNDLQMLTDAGYTCMQGGFFGKRADNNLFDTLNADEWPRGSSFIRPYDNIAISNNMHIINAQVITQNGSDHYPIIADIVFNDT